MRSSDSPFPCHWWGFGLENAGLGEVRPDVATYGRYKFEDLPKLPFELRGDFAWLVSAPEQGENIGKEGEAANANSLRRLEGAAHRQNVSLPTAFVAFISSPALWSRVRSNTLCYLWVCPEPVPSPIGTGFLVRFLADSQGCLFWYLYLSRDGSDHAVVSSPCFYGAANEPWDDEPPDPSEIIYCAGSFEEFMGRFWVENEVWFSCFEKTPMSDVAREYVARYRRAARQTP